MQIDSLQIALASAFERSTGLLPTFLSQQVSFRFVEPLPDDPHECGGGADVESIIFTRPTDKSVLDVKFSVILKMDQKSCLFATSLRPQN